MTSKILFERKEHSAAFLDPENVGSSIRWTLHAVVRSYTPEGKEAFTGSTVDAEVSLSDCSRVITWSAHGRGTYEQMIRKLDAALVQLVNCRDALVAMKAESVTYHTAPREKSEDDYDY